MATRFEKAYNALIKGYFEGTLAKGTCVACAVGNIIADAQGDAIRRITCSESLYGTHEGVIAAEYEKFICDNNNTWWSKLFCTGFLGLQYRNRELPIIASKLFDLTGYTDDELAMVEFAFEQNSVIPCTLYEGMDELKVLEDQFNGLSAVVDVLIKLDNIDNEDNKYNKKFREHPKLINA